MLDELDHLLGELDLLSGPEGAAVGEATAVGARLPLARAVTNVISQLLFAQRLADNEEFREINRLMLEDVVAMNPIAEFIPWYHLSAYLSHKSINLEYTRMIKSIA